MKWGRFFKKILLFSLMAWMAGFFFYLYHIHQFNRDIPTPADGIVILTGGRGRIQKGLKLLEKAPDKPVLITGVRTRGQLKQITIFPQHEENIDLGFKATTTRENAKEISEWDKVKSCRSLTVVTSHYHLPRSLLELKAALPHIRLMPYPIIAHTFQKGKWVAEPDLWYLLFKEYNKYLIVFSEMHIKSLLK